MNEFEGKVRMLIAKKKLSYTEVAEKVGMSQPNFSKKLSKNNFHETDMRKLSEVLGVRLEINLVLEDGTRI